eukprot:Rmarinus@m.13838
MVEDIEIAVDAVCPSTLDMRCIFTGHTHPILSFTYNSSRGHMLSTDGHSLILWNHQGKLRKAIPFGKEGKINCLIYNHTQKFYFSVVESVSCALYDTLLNVCFFKRLHERPILCAAQHSTCQEIVTAGVDGIMRFWKITKPSATGQIKFAQGIKMEERLMVHTDDRWIKHLFIEENRDRLFACMDIDVIVYEYSTGSALYKIYNLHSGKITGMHFCSYSKYLLTSSSDGSVRAWEFQNGQILNTSGFPQARKKVNGIEVYYPSSSPEHALILTSCDDGCVRCWDLHGGNLLDSINVTALIPTHILHSFNSYDLHHFVPTTLKVLPPLPPSLYQAQSLETANTGGAGDKKAKEHSTEEDRGKHLVGGSDGEERVGEERVLLVSCGMVLIVLAFRHFLHLFARVSDRIVRIHVTIFRDDSAPEVETLSCDSCLLTLHGETGETLRTLAPTGMSRKPPDECRCDEGDYTNKFESNHLQSNMTAESHRAASVHRKMRRDLLRMRMQRLGVDDDASSNESVSSTSSSDDEYIQAVKQKYALREETRKDKPKQKSKRNVQLEREMRQIKARAEAHGPEKTMVAECRMCGKKRVTLGMEERKRTDRLNRYCGELRAFLTCRTLDTLFVSWTTGRVDLIDRETGGRTQSLEASDLKSEVSVFCLIPRTSYHLRSVAETLWDDVETKVANIAPFMPDGCLDFAGAHDGNNSVDEDLGPYPPDSARLGEAAQHLGIGGQGSAPPTARDTARDETTEYPEETMRPKSSSSPRGVGTNGHEGLPHEKGLCLVAATDAGHLILYSLPDGMRLRVLKPHAASVVEILFLPQRSMLVTASIDGVIKFWNAATFREVMELECREGLVVLTSHGLNALLCGYEDGTIDVLSIDEKDAHSQASTALEPVLEKRTKLHAGKVTSIVSSPSGLHFISTSADRTLIMWDFASVEIYRMFSFTKAPVQASYLNRHGDVLIAFQHHLNVIHASAFSAEVEESDVVSTTVDREEIIEKEWSIDVRDILLRDQRTTHKYEVTFATKNEAADIAMQHFWNPGARPKVLSQGFGGLSSAETKDQAPVKLKIDTHTPSENSDTSPKTSGRKSSGRLSPHQKRLSDGILLGQGNEEKTDSRRKPKLRKSRTDVGAKSPMVDDEETSNPNKGSTKVSPAQTPRSRRSPRVRRTSVTGTTRPASDPSMDVTDAGAAVTSSAAGSFVSPAMPERTASATPALGRRTGPAMGVAAAESSDSKKSLPSVELPSHDRRQRFLKQQGRARPSSTPPATTSGTSTPSTGSMANITQRDVRSSTDRLLGRPQDCGGGSPDSETPDPAAEYPNGSMSMVASGTPRSAMGGSATSLGGKKNPKRVSFHNTTTAEEKSNRPISGSRPDSRPPSAASPSTSLSTGVKLPPLHPRGVPPETAETTPSHTRDGSSSTRGANATGGRGSAPDGTAAAVNISARSAASGASGESAGSSGSAFSQSSKGSRRRRGSKSKVVHPGQVLSSGALRDADLKELKRFRRGSRSGVFVSS